MEPSKTRRMKRQVTIGVMLVITALFTWYLAEVFYFQRDRWTDFFVVAGFPAAIISARLLLRRRNSN
jgi:hypothetical protein